MRSHRIEQSYLYICSTAATGRLLQRWKDRELGGSLGIDDLLRIELRIMERICARTRQQKAFDNTRKQFRNALKALADATVRPRRLP